MKKWVDVVAQNAPLLKVTDRVVMIGGNIKIAKKYTNITKIMASRN
jgi:hypothetical protein